MKKSFLRRSETEFHVKTIPVRSERHKENLDEIADSYTLLFASSIERRKSRQIPPKSVVLLLELLMLLEKKRWRLDGKEEKETG